MGLWTPALGRHMGWATPRQLVDVPDPQIAAALIDLHGAQTREQGRDRLLTEIASALVDLRRMVADALGWKIPDEHDQQAGQARGRTVEEYRQGKPAHTQARSAESYLERKREVVDAAA